MKTKYLIDSDHSNINFTVKHMMLSKVHGTFKKIQGLLVYDIAAIENSQVEVKIDVKSINTRDQERDQHLVSSEFLDANKFPYIFFISKRFSANGDDLTVVGDLTIHGVTQSVTLNMNLPQYIRSPSVIKTTGKSKIKRKDYGLVWNAVLEAGGILVGDEITIQLDMQLIKDQEP